ncbi:hypothetical protein FBU30_000308 [Linnemannia zychae]|nr:hypothetical protein FBU30_000308 [Linnemannia zychae]
MPKPTSQLPLVKGKAFDHIFIIFLENTNFALAASDPYLSTLASQGIALTNYHGLTHPSQPNYIAAIGGDYYGLNNDLDTTIPANYTTIVDLLEPKGLTWKAYMEDMPEVCFLSAQTLNTDNIDGKNLDGLYFRKHNPFILHESISKNSTRCQNVVPASQLTVDLAEASKNGGPQLPNYMFYTPNMINDGHNTTIRDASAFLSTFLPSIRSNSYFTSSRSLIVVTFDETEDYFIPDNLIYTILLGSNDNVISPALKGTTDNTFYTHYSLLSTVEDNWDLGNLGRNDANKTLANVFSLVANKTNYKNIEIAKADIPILNETIPGFLTGAPHVSSRNRSPSFAN